MQETTMTNIDAEKVAEALAVYTDDKRTIDAANGRLRSHQLHYEQEHGIDAAAVRERYKESLMTAAERRQKFATEYATRRAVGLWEAETDSDFDQLMERAREVQKASGEGADKLTAARAYGDGFNGGLKGKMAITDNPHAAGSMQHQQWAIGCADGIDQRPTAPTAVEPEPPSPPPVETAPAAPKRRDRKAANGQVPASKVV
jgi:hypothetical protein